MIKKFALCIVSVFCAASAAVAADFPEAARAGSGTSIQQNPVPFSNAGLIQNVQGYSSNPYWNPNSPYNQRLPTPIYAQGTELNAGECQGVTASIVYSECSRRNNCSGLRVHDIRSAVMQQLAALPGRNYVSACNGFIDSAFAEFQKSAQATVTPSAFPMAGTGNAGVAGGAVAGGRELILNNPFEIRHPAWKEGMFERFGEMQNLQKQNAPDTKLAKKEMPTTFDDLPFEERMRILKEGYEPWQQVIDPKTGKCIKNCTYHTNFNIETDEKKRDRERLEAEHRQQVLCLDPKYAMTEMCKAIFCRDNPNHPNCKPGTGTPTQNTTAPGSNNERLNAIIQLLKDNIPK